MKLILFGGVQGVGKSILISWLKSGLRSKITVVDPGKMFRRYVYKQKLKTAGEVEDLVVKKLTQAPCNSIVMAHWHYAVRRPSGYISQVSFERLKRIAENGKIEQVVLLLVKAPANIILQRRLTDWETKNTRALSVKIIREEIKTEKVFFAKYRALFSQILGCQKVVAFQITNKELHKTQSVLRELFEKLV